MNLTISDKSTVDVRLQVKIVLANGDVMIVNESTNKDLFWAVRGSGSNFGVVTEFVYKLHDQRTTIYGGILTFPAPIVPALFEVTAKWMKNKPSPDAAMQQVFTRMPTPERTVSLYSDMDDLPLLKHFSFKPAAMAVVFFNGGEEEGREEFKDFLALSECPQ